MFGAVAQGGEQSLRSPVYGTVKQIKFHTLGGVLQPAEQLMEIVPIEDTLLIEAQIRPQDRGFIAPQPGRQDQDHGVRLQYLRRARCQSGADQRRRHRKRKERAVLPGPFADDRNYLIGKDGGELQIIPGMTATVDILTGKKTVLMYLLKPILKARDTALSER
ncbi:MAG: HlyD family efflux transporter periplasmic adaptor subunit [Rhodospirillaceae bacterium]|nr:HlyD family efflux transporter periplasmic adaptor subunit [Rhodospirillaceae bacterium]